jgi:hypothetical protein
MQLGLMLLTSLKEINSNQLNSAEFLIQNTLALGLMKKLLAQTDVGSIPTGYDIST